MLAMDTDYDHYEWLIPNEILMVRSEMDLMNIAVSG